MANIFGTPDQMGYVVRDIEAGMNAWLDLGVGPWFYVKTVETDWFKHRGQDSPVELSIALANCGDMQIELICQRNDAPSMYKEFIDSGREGFQHVSFWTEDFEALRERALADGHTVGHEGCIGGEKGRFTYLEKPGAEAAATVIEISDITGPKGMFFDHIREVAADWDGTEAIRKLN